MSAASTKSLLAERASAGASGPTRPRGVTLLEAMTQSFGEVDGTEPSSPTRSRSLPGPVGS